MQVIEPIFDKVFISDSYSSRKKKGTHKAVAQFKKYAWALSQNGTKVVWVLKCDIKKFFDSIDHDILLALIKKKIKDEKAQRLIENIVRSFHGETGTGIPLGNVTSQLFSNIYLNEMDQFVKHDLRARYYIRYADDFVVLSRDKLCLRGALLKISTFLRKELKLQLHEKKVCIRKWNSGVDFLGYVVFPYHAILRTKTKRRILKKMRKKSQELLSGEISETALEQARQSYLGVLKHCRGYGIKKIINDVSGDCLC